VQDALPRQAVARLDEGAGHGVAGGAQLRRQGLVQEGADLVTEGQVGGVQGQVHQRTAISKASA
jgi:predicted ribosome-associated RNA-binding protein Tma20